MKQLSDEQWYTRALVCNWNSKFFYSKTKIFSNCSRKNVSSFDVTETTDSWAIYWLPFMHFYLYCKTIAETNDVIEREFIYFFIKTFKWKIIASFQCSALLLLTTKKKLTRSRSWIFYKMKKKVQISNIWRHALSSDDEWLKKKRRRKKSTASHLYQMSWRPERQV